MKVSRFGPRSLRIELRRHEIKFNNGAIGKGSRIDVTDYVQHEMFAWLVERGIKRQFYFDEGATYGGLRTGRIVERYAALFRRPFIVEFETDSDAVLFKLRWFNDDK